MKKQQQEYYEIAWYSISELFLDTELKGLELKFIAKQLLQTPFTESELNEILIYDVAPVCYGNLLATTGVWEGFDKEWLFSEIQNNKSKNQKIFRLKCKLIKCFYGSALQSQWTIVLEKLRNLRSDCSIP
ncbi:DUF7079 family protein [Zooshikella ganghwensis]|uniref:DUF7079 domain-containing protein n=1 Tax=Zooshikella ganghwensis TaxID=202772 RepID=A0A4P9VQR3_9GAMM|nr:hypothetical protein [Zooshikella ganghwensis]RDH45119.1 hypothetical protein B9G39_17675 [Zooshikella ganghwensis]